jgi:hypothetical protein
MKLYKRLFEEFCNCENMRLTAASYAQRRIASVTRPGNPLIAVYFEVCHPALPARQRHP